MKNKNYKDLIYNNLYDTPFSNTIAKKRPNVTSHHDFIISEKTEINTSFDISKVIGVSHPDYNNRTWAEIVKHLKREINLDLSFDGTKTFYSADYYKNKDIKIHWKIDVINGEAYVNEGHHRTVISKYLSFLGLVPSVIFGLNVTYYEVDFEKQEKIEKIKKSFLTKYPLVEDLTINAVSIEKESNNSEFYKEYDIKFTIKQLGIYNGDYVSVEADSLEELESCLYNYFVPKNLFWKLENKILLMKTYLKNKKDKQKNEKVS
ncbi:hypothetical protein CRU86_08575 [Aliarcobacter skirrowii]|uniref:hypothetical protein n=1 Tax=Aliarcobacter skirrowii TaxID=28200 RepID=UPI00100A3590|nr:hypothetical protein [Aliarcobacter skirrowii]RXJ75333.1 hypothetical protein CRU86_08575 [Aliarcobacter skirrowii]